MRTAAPPEVVRTRGGSAAPGRRGGGALNLASLWTLYVLTLRQHLRGKRWVVMAALFLLPAGLALVLRATAPNVPPVGLEFIFAFMFIPQALLPIVGLLYASGIIQDEQEEQTLTYLLIRPIPKWALYAFKLLATLTTTVVLTTVFTAITYAAIYAGNNAGGADVAHRCLTAAGIHALAVVAYCCLFGMMSLVTKRTLVMGILYVAIVEGVLANMPLSMRLLTVIYYTRVIAYRLLSFVIPVPGGRLDIAADLWQLDLLHDPKLLEHPGVATCVRVVLLASLALSIFAAVVCSRREFHVKTPEKG